MGLGQEKAFANIKNKFLSCVMLAHPDFERKMYLHTDASNVGLGACLYQVYDNGQHKVIDFVRRIVK